jgi:hypothetical protein
MIKMIKKKRVEKNTIKMPNPYRDLRSVCGCFNRDLNRTNPEVMPNLPKLDSSSAALNKVLNNPIWSGVINLGIKMTAFTNPMATPR